MEFTTRMNVSTGYKIAQPSQTKLQQENCPVIYDAISKIISFKGRFADRLVEFETHLKLKLALPDIVVTTPLMSHEEQVRLVCLVLAVKAEFLIDDSEITITDFYSMLLKLERSPGASSEIKRVLALYRQYDPETFLTEGIDIYNQRTQRDIKLNVKEDFNRIDMAYECLFNPKLKNESVEVKYLLSSGMSSRQIFLQYPECRLDSCLAEDLKGEIYLRDKLGIDTSLAIQKIKIRFWTVEQAAAAFKNTKLNFQLLLEKNAVKLNEAEMTWESMTSSEKNRHSLEKTLFFITLESLRQKKIILESNVVERYVAAGLLAREMAMILSLDQIVFLEMPAIQKSIDKSELKVGQVLKLPGKDMLNYGLYMYIDRGDLSPCEAASLTREQKAMLNQVDIQMLVASEEKTVKEVLGLC